MVIFLISVLGIIMLFWAFWIRFEVKSLKKEFIKWDGGKDFFTWEYFQELERQMKQKDGESDT